MTRQPHQMLEPAMSPWVKKTDGFVDKHKATIAGVAISAVVFVGAVVAPSDRVDPIE